MVLRCDVDGNFVVWKLSYVWFGIRDSVLAPIKSRILFAEDIFIRDGDIIKYSR
jgi:hypothetical protein